MNFQSIYNKKIGFLTPYFTSNRGNATTTKRIVTGLMDMGLNVTVFAYNEMEYTRQMEHEIEQCDFLHILHFYRFSKWLKEKKLKLTLPYILTSGGTDINTNLMDEKQLGEMSSLILGASAITVFSDDAKVKLINAFPQLNSNDIRVIPQSVWLPEEEQPVKTKLPSGSPKLLIPAGLRAVKDVLFLEEAFYLLRERYPMIQLIFVGPKLDETIYLQVLSLVEKNDWIHYFGEIPFESMKNFYRWADYVINSSKSEGQSGAILEAMSLGVLVLARNNPGNASVINDGQNGYLYNSPNEFIEKITNVMNQPRKRQYIVNNASKFIDEKFAMDTELAAYLQLYEKL